ncbi:hypothetical protein BON30_26885 [Cystobacter ferrugineus]|uniref:Uncharacterized protein n=1 Tax=Cystobacter ferrugineus TaxID=83449 RepID=A0A1L9B6C7_9BACT|nr:hypothetical protein BON30_26885 [Cystobacter ferrugineus]
MAIPLLAWSYERVHNVRSSSLTSFREDDYAQNRHIDYPVVSGPSTFVWQENTMHGFGHINAKVAVNGKGEFFQLKLVRISSSDANSINGEWDVFKDQVPTCAGCKGYVYVTSPGASPEYLKGYVSNGLVSYGFTANLDPNTRYDE